MRNFLLLLALTACGTADDASTDTDADSDAPATDTDAPAIDTDPVTDTETDPGPIDADGDGWTSDVDCDDDDADVHPEATEVPADGVDQDCDGLELCFEDLDGDGHGTTTTVPSADLTCTAAGLAPDDLDCDDEDEERAEDCSIRIGNDVEFAEESSNAPHLLLGSAITVPDAMTVTHLALIGKAGRGNVVMALYTDSGGTPDALVVGTSSTPVVDGVLKIPVTPTAVSPGTYWLMAVYDIVTSVGFDDSSPLPLVMYRTHEFDDSLPDPFGDASSFNGQRFNYYVVGY